MAQQPHEVVWSLINAVVPARCIHVVADLGVADCIDDEPVGVKELASQCSADPEALDRVLRLLAAHGIFECRGDSYAHNDASRLLRSDHPMSMRGFGRMMGLPVFLASFDHLDHSVRTGTPSIQRVAPDGMWPYLQAHPAEEQIFGRAMTGKAAADIAAVLASYDFSRFENIADIGGGRGHLLRAVLDAVPAARGILFDLPTVIDSLEIGRDRLSPRAGDFFVDPLPEADLYILMEVIHDWADAEAAAILSAVRRAASPDSRVLIIEGVVPEGLPDPRVHTLDVIMLAVTGGRERSAAELNELLEGAGFRPERVIPTPGAMRIVEAVAV